MVKIVSHLQFRYVQCRFMLYCICKTVMSNFKSVSLSDILPLCCVLRFLHYDCVVAPESSITGKTGFPWEKITLLVEYEPLKRPLFDPDGGSGSHGEARAITGEKGEAMIDVKRLKLKEYVTLKTAFKGSTKCKNYITYCTH